MSYEYYADQQEALIDPNTYLASNPLSMVRQFSRAMGQELDQPYVHDRSLYQSHVILTRLGFPNR